MTGRLMVLGTIAPRSQPAAMRVRGAVVQPTRTPIVATLTPCRFCGELVCDCQDWLEWMLLAEPEPQECIGDES
jgi:hypothetical protein